MFFDKRNLATPDNFGECKESLNILKTCGYTPGLLQLLNTHKETGIVGDKKDLARR